MFGGYTVLLNVSGVFRARRLSGIFAFGGVDPLVLSNPPFHGEVSPSHMHKNSKNQDIA